MDDDDILKNACAELVSRFSANTILLYGSRADASHGDDSDFDIAAFGTVDKPFRISRLVGSKYLDIFVYPDVALIEPTEDYLKLRGARIIQQQNGMADTFLSN
jgi:predicted nucleotidyltransferase